MQLSNRIADLRSRAGKTQQQVVEELTVLNQGKAPFNRSAMAHWERGHCQPSLKHLLLLSRYFGVEMSEILGAQEGHSG